MPRVASAWSFSKGGEEWRIVEQIRISPSPKGGGQAGKQLRFLSASRGQSVITDVDQCTLAVNRQCRGLPAMQRIWFHPRGFSLGYTKPRGSPGPAELFFLDLEARVCSRRNLAAGVIDASAGDDQWFLACSDGRVYAFTLEGRAQWNELVPYPPRDNSSNARLGLPVFHPRLHLASDGSTVAVGAEQDLHRYDASGERLWTEFLPRAETTTSQIRSTDLPTRDDRLSKLGLRQTVGPEGIQTGYLRLGLDTTLNGGWLKQVQISDHEGAEEADVALPVVGVQVGFPFQPGISVLQASGYDIVVGVQNGLVHVFSREGMLRKTFHAGDGPVSELLVNGEGLKAAHCAGRLTLFDEEGVTGATELPEYFVDLAECGVGVLAWKFNSVWLIEPSGRVQLAAQAACPNPRRVGACHGIPCTRRRRTGVVSEGPRYAGRLGRTVWL
jgi:hypothetical protein